MNCPECGRFLAIVDDGCIALDFDRQCVLKTCTNLDCYQGDYDDYEAFGKIWDEIDKERIKENPAWEKECEP